MAAGAAECAAMGLGGALGIDSSSSDKGCLLGTTIKTQAAAEGVALPGATVATLGTLAIGKLNRNMVTWVVRES